MDGAIAEDLQKQCILGLMERIRSLEKDVYGAVLKLLFEFFLPLLAIIANKLVFFRSDS